MYGSGEGSWRESNGNLWRRVSRRPPRPTQTASFRGGEIPTKDVVCGPLCNCSSGGDLTEKWGKSLNAASSQINGKDVTTASHETVVGLIRKSGEAVKLTVVTVPSFVEQFVASQQGSSATLPRRMPAASTTTTSSPQMTLGQQGRAPPPAPPRRDPNTTLSVGRAQARSMVASIATIGECSII